MTLKCGALLVLAAAVMLGCSLFQAPLDDVKVLNASFDPDFSKNGIINLSVIPVDSEGRALTWIDSVSAVAKYGFEEENLDADQEDRVEPSSKDPWAIAIDIDSSGSMGSNDSQRLRVDASKLFVKNILNAKSSSEFNIYDFGAGSTTGYTNTRKLTADWTSDEYEIDTAINKVVASGSTPLYESVLEVLEDVNTDKSSSSWQRALLVLSDGSPSSTTYCSAVYSYAQANKIPVNTVSLGSGTYEQTMSDLAQETGGIYAGATDAASLSDAFEAISLGTSEGYLVYTLKFKDPEDLLSSSASQG